MDSIAALLLHKRHCLPRILQTQLLHLLVERRAVDAEQLGGGVAIPIVRLQRVENDLAFRGVQRGLERYAGRWLYDHGGS